MWPYAPEMSSSAVHQNAVLTGDDAIHGLAAVEGLLAEVEAPITARVPWLRAWAGATQAQPVLVVVRDGPAVTAAAPLALRRRGPVVEVLAWGHQDSDQVCLPVRAAADADALADAVLAHLQGLGRPWTLRVEQLPVDALAGLALARTLPRAALGEGDVSPRTVFGPERTLAQHLSRNGRRSALQAGNRMAAAGFEPQVAYWRHPDDVRRHLSDLEDLRRRRDHALGRPSAMDTPSRREFYRTVVLGAAAAGELELATLHLDGRLAAYDVCFVDRGWLRLWDGRIEPDLAHFGVGKLLDARVLERALVDATLLGVDWMRGDEPYKSRSANDRVAHQHLVASSSAAAWAVSFGGPALRAAARERVAEHPAVLERWRAVKTHALALRRARR